MRYLAIEEAIQVGIKATISYNNPSYVTWCSRLDEDINKNKVKLTVTYDMGWYKRSYGRRYESSSGNDSIIGVIYKGIIDMVIYSIS